ncbi:phage scaffolding protein [Paenibacillus alkaliterrae]|uniref:phage scaffolding protein n=1 Tax=Paenibacillus alkaliterrae TaxID=320909 RepID=UPI001F33CF8B|nr:phage scaffolding protein [Paenibacillus alkaliterrae]MCF2939036.1 phage scaffolding protein [Paenibacillus alkaliterrae]
MDLKELLGEELYKQVIEKLGDKHKVAVISDGNWIPKDTFNQVNEAKKQLETDLKDRDKQLTDLKKSAGDNETLKQQISVLQEDNKKSAGDYEAKIKDMKVAAAIEKALGAANAKFPDLLLSKVDKAKIELLQDDTVRGLEDQIKTLKESYKELFGEDKLTGGNPGKGNNPNHAGTKNPWKKESFNLTEQGRLLRDDPALANELMAAAK